MNPKPNPPKDREFLTYGRSRAVRLEDFDYSADAIIHLIICSEGETTLTDPALAETICENVTYYSKKLQYELYGYCLMPDHLHVLAYIVENPVRRGLVDDWKRWPWTRVLIDL